jgi:hypothetical protein
MGVEMVLQPNCDGNPKGMAQRQLVKVGCSKPPKVTSGLSLKIRRLKSVSNFFYRFNGSFEAQCAAFIAIQSRLWICLATGFDRHQVRV